MTHDGNGSRRFGTRVLCGGTNPPAPRHLHEIGNRQPVCRVYRSEREDGEVIDDDRLTETDSGFEAFYAQWREPLRRAVALATGDVMAAGEAIDEAMTRALVRWDRISSYDKPEGWVYRVALNWSKGLFRKRNRELLTAIDVEGRRSDSVPDLDLIEAVERLSLRHRAVVVGRFYLDWTTAEVAQALDVAEGTVKSRLSRALDQLASDLGGES